jgi:hypothetical protein
MLMQRVGIGLGFPANQLRGFDMSIPFSRPDTYQTFNQWMADAHSLMARIQGELDGVELCGGPLDDGGFISNEALNQLIEMTDAFGHLLKLDDQHRQQAA